MREIKFRGKPIGSSEWVYGNFLYKEEESPVIETNEIYKNYFIEAQDFTGYYFEVVSETIGQFIGLYDKTVKEVYEEDIVMYNYDGNIIRGVVVFKDLAYHIKYKDQDMFDAYQRIYDWSGKYIEVIGNIHENPELL